MERDPHSFDPNQFRDPVNPDNNATDPNQFRDPRNPDPNPGDPNRLHDPMSPDNNATDPSQFRDPVNLVNNISDPTQPLGPNPNLTIDSSTLRDPANILPNESSPVFSLLGAKGALRPATIARASNTAVSPGYGIAISVLVYGGDWAPHWLLGFKQAALEEDVTYFYTDRQVQFGLKQPCGDMAVTNDDGWINPAQVVVYSQETTTAPQVITSDTPSMGLPQPNMLNHEIYGELRSFYRSLRLCTWLVAQTGGEKIPLYHWDWKTEVKVSYDTGQPEVIGENLSIISADQGPGLGVGIDAACVTPAANDSGALKIIDVKPLL